MLLGYGVDNLILLIMIWNGLKEEEFALKLVYLGFDGVSTFWGFKFGVMAQIQK